MSNLLNFRPLIPMGAIKPNEKELEAAIEDPNYVAEVKYDGYRMLSWQGLDEARFTTRSIGIDSIRSGNPTPTERTDNLPHLRNLKNGDLDGTVLDGEIWKLNGRSHDITSMIGGLPETSLENQIRDGFVSHMLYDIIQFQGKSVTHLIYTERRKLLEHVYKDLIFLDKDWNFKHPETGEILCTDITQYLKLSEIVKHDDIRDKYEEVVRNGGEGLILKCKSSIYHLGKIGSNGKGVPSKVKANKRKNIYFTPWIKYKKYDTYDCVIMGFSPTTIIYTGNDESTWKFWQDAKTDRKFMIDVDTSEGMSILNDPDLDLLPITKFYYYDWPGAIIFGQYNKEGELVEVGQTSGITDEMRQEFAQNPEFYIGKVCEVGCMEQLKAPTYSLREPRFLRIREAWDKNPFECILPK